MSNIEDPNHLSEYFFKSINSNNKINLKIFQEYHQSIGGDSSNFFESITSIDEHGLNFLYYVKLERKDCELPLFFIINPLILINSSKFSFNKYIFMSLNI